MKIFYGLLVGACAVATVPCFFIAVNLEGPLPPVAVKRVEVAPLKSAVYLLTAYSHGCTMPGPGKKEIRRPAANGQWPIANETVAADWARHKPGTILLIEDLGFREVTDKGGRIKKRRLDMFKKDCTTAKNFGVQKKLVIEVPSPLVSHD